MPILVIRINFDRFHAKNWLIINICGSNYMKGRPKLHIICYFDLGPKNFAAKF